MNGVNVPKTHERAMYYEKLTKKPAIYLHPEDFLAGCADYFKWATEHPLLEDKAFNFQGVVIHDDLQKMRPFTKRGLATFLGMTTEKLNRIAKRGEAWADALERVEDVIYTQKFEGAAAGLLNAGIITRDLGLTEKQEVQSTTTGTLEVTEKVPDEMVANLVHPDDPNPLNLPRPLYSRAQIDSGMQFVAPPHDAQ